MKPMITFALLLFMALTSACDKSESELCGGDDPEESLTWLEDEIKSLSASAYCNSISRSTYKGQTVFILSTCDPNVNSVPILYGCEGNKLKLSVEEYQNLNFTGEIELIWKNP